MDKLKESHSKNILWVTDPWDQLIHDKETTLRWIQESVWLGQVSYWTDYRSIRIENEVTQLIAYPVLEAKESLDTNCFKMGDPISVSATEFDQIHYRVDPPVNQHYLHPLQMLALNTRDTQTEFINPLEVLFLANEKFENFLLGKLTPPTLIATQKESFQAFFNEYQKVVIKPIFDARGRGTAVLDHKSKEDQSKFEKVLKNLTFGFTSPALMQVYLNQIHDGEIRLWFLDGELLSSFKKFPMEGDFRVNVTGGSPIERYSLGSSDKKAVEKIGRLLKRRRIRLAAVDLINGQCTDFNFTSPGLMVQMEALYGENFSKIVLEKLTKPFSS